MKYLIYIIISLLFIACSSIRVTSDYDRNANFYSYKTFEFYGWKDSSDKVLNRFDKERIEKAFGYEFKSRGLELVQEDGDLVVSLFIVAEQKTQTTADTYHHGGYGGYYGYGPGWGWGGGHSTTTFHDYEYLEGTLVCDVYDNEKQQLIWEGIGTKTISESPQKREKNIPIAVGKIMEQYPIKPIPDKK